jgi:hypothetical protein
MKYRVMVFCALVLAACEEPSATDGGEAAATSAIKEVGRGVEKILGVDDEEEGGESPGNANVNGEDGERVSVPVARPVPDKPGFVVSPYNGKWIDVTGIEPGSLVADPHARPEEKKYFRVPFPADETPPPPPPTEDTESPDDPSVSDPVV